MQQGKHDSDSSRFNKKKRAGMVAVAAIAAGSTLCASEREAQAAIDPLTVINVIRQVYGVFQQLQSLLGDKGPTVAQQLAAVQGALTAEMRTQRNLALVSQTNAVFNLFRNLADNSRTDPTNVDLWANIVTQQQLTADAMHDIIVGTNDAESSYQLAPAYNMLLGTGALVLKAKGEFAPSDPSSWWDFHLWLHPGNKADYHMIRSQSHLCWPGFNPGPTIQVIPFSGHVANMKPGKFRESQLYTKKLANKFFVVASGTSRNVSPCRTPDPIPFTIECHPITRACKTVSIRLDCVHMESATITRKCAAGVSDLACADQLAKTAFDTDATVKIIREGMTNIMARNGGNDFDDPDDLNQLVPSGQLVEAYVDESSCPVLQGGRWAYPYLP